MNDCKPACLPLLGGPRIPRLFGFKNFLNKRLAYCRTSAELSFLCGPRVPRLLGFHTFLISDLVTVACLRNSNQEFQDKTIILFILTKKTKTEMTRERNF